jgi:hypothetical protein
MIGVLFTAIDLHGAEELVKGFIISYNKDSRDYGGIGYWKQDKGDIGDG